jgi:hypothetical protein
MTETVFCTQCGQTNPANATFCTQCGQPIYAPDTDNQSQPVLPVISAQGMPDFISLTCPSCGGALEVGQDVRQLTCLHCGTKHDVIREQGGPVLQPMLEQIEQISRTLTDEEIMRQSAAKSTQAVEQQSAEMAAQLQREAKQQAAFQEILILEQKIRENEAFIKEKDTSEKLVGYAFLGLFISVALGGVGELILRSQNSFPYDDDPVGIVIFSFIGVFIFFWMLLMSSFKSPREGSRRKKENEQLKKRIQGLRSKPSTVASAPAVAVPSKSVWQCKKCGTLNDAAVNQCRTCATARKKKGGAGGVVLVIFLVIGFLCLAMLIIAGAISAFSTSGSSNSSTQSMDSYQPAATKQDARNNVYPNPPLEGCVIWSDISAADAGSFLCVYGLVYDYYADDQQNNYVRFSDQSTAFRMILTSGQSVKLAVEDCVYQSGEVKAYGEMPYMELSEPLIRCVK